LGVEDSWFFKDFQIFFQGAVGPFGGRAKFFDQVVTFRPAWDFTPLENQRKDRIAYSSEMVL